LFVILRGFDRLFDISWKDVLRAKFLAGGAERIGVNEPLNLFSR
jgi:hypothetical protein